MRFVLAVLILAGLATGAVAEIGVTESADQIDISTSALTASIRKKGCVSGEAGGSLVDRKAGSHDAGFGPEIVDWLLEPGSDEAYRDKLQGDLTYEFNNLYHGSRLKRSIEGPQICTRAKELSPRVIRGRDFVAVTMDYQYQLSAGATSLGSR